MKRSDPQIDSRHLSPSAESTLSYGHLLGKELKAGSILAFYGDLGAGKTTLIKGIAESAAGLNPEVVNSPTFNYLNIYTGAIAIYHFDLYRLRRLEEFMTLGFEEYFEAGGICCIEWAERIEPLLPQNTLYIEIEYDQENSRRIVISKKEN